MKSLVFTIAVMAAVSSARAQDSTNIDAHAERVLRAACQYLAESPFFSINAEIWREHLTDDGEKVQFSRSMDMEVKRPNRLHAELQSPHSNRGFWYDGKTLNVLDRKRNLFSTTSVPSNLDEAVDAARDKFGIDLPMIDLAISDPFKNAMAQVQSAHYFGLAPTMGYMCHHLAFTQENIDWQVWIQDGPQPLIRKFVITHKDEPGSPEFTGLIRQWNFIDRIADSDFVFVPPPDAARIQMREDSGEPSENTTLRPTGPTEPRNK
jgi:hypothetical protein